jgi:diguanylate cyclase (GGDEF)-like protein
MEMLSLRARPRERPRLTRIVHLRQRPEVAILIVVYAVAAVCLLLAATFPMVPYAPVRFERALGVFAFAGAALLWCTGGRIGRPGLQTAVACFTVAASFLISRANTAAGLMMIAWAYAWIGIYVAFFFRGREIYLHAALVTVGCVSGFLIADIPRTFIEAVIINVTIWAGAIAFGSLSERLREQADTDHLTGLLNRHGFKKAATRELALAWRTGNPLAVAVIDLDGFKDVNDAHGHAAGDRLLAELAHAWERELRPGDILARHGGDEFVVLFPATSAEDARTALERLRARHDMRWSAGVAAWQRGEPLGGCLARADASLYEAKASGGGIALAGALAPVTA